MVHASHPYKAVGNTDHNNLKKALMDLQTSAQEVVLQWIPGHCNIFGNEVADELAKKGSELEQIHQDLNLNETRTIINATIDKRWKETHPQYDKKDHIYNLSHADQVTIFRLRCGHNRLCCHMFNCFKLGETARCECGADKQDAQHILQDCILYSDHRSAIWPTEVSLKKKALWLMLRPAADHRVHQDYISDHLELTGERKEEVEKAFSFVPLSEFSKAASFISLTRF